MIKQKIESKYDVLVMDTAGDNDYWCTLHQGIPEADAKRIYSEHDPIKTGVVMCLWPCDVAYTNEMEASFEMYNDTEVENGKAVYEYYRKDGRPLKTDDGPYAEGDYRLCVPVKKTRTRKTMASKEAIS